ncbi:cyclic nucleotide-binding domain-containing protein [Microbulbifer sp. OS29]|uniref:Cyclic nucleotide-binding domain-containing protein n=1 Tax=Microbulbifer okhotskensis TaxID=2926617 RepID=A0A9X2EPL7_9GAMM|nr:cyclic nucleotide-binding domain-containing protein [Microbulbifer okhotskensis]MCO1336112.1 cyclic nucleotide-binding domain-containing protein [Microbulbifer okhotskensis]
MKNIASLLHEHPFFHGLSGGDLNFLATCAENSRYKEGEYLAKESAPANHFFLIRSGRVAVETFVPNHGPLCLMTLQDGDIFGWSWLYPPYLTAFDARALSPVRCLRLGGKCLREKCESEPRLGFELMKRFARIATERLQAARIQLLDVYGPHPSQNPVQRRPHL